MLVIASISVEEHRFLNHPQAHVVSKTTVCIHNVREVVDMDSWRATAPFPSECMQAAPDTSFNKYGNPGSAQNYQWYTKIEVACRNPRSALLALRSCDEELDYQFQLKLEEENLRNQIRLLNPLH